MKAICSLLPLVLYIRTYIYEVIQCIHTCICTYRYVYASNHIVSLFVNTDVVLDIHVRVYTVYMLYLLLLLYV